MSADGENGAHRRRLPGPRLTPAEVEELSPRAYALAIERNSYREIGRKLGVHENTVRRLVNLELEIRRVTHLRMVEGQIGTYDLIARDALALHRDLRAQGKDSAQNAVASLNAATTALSRIDVLAGLEAPKRSKVTQTRIDPSGLSEGQLRAINALADQAYAIAEGKLPVPEDEEGEGGL
jgi:DNA-binding CsgD family transcriptional regulator